MYSNKDIAQPTDISPRTAAVVAGFGLLTMAVLAAFANFGVLERLIVADDAGATAANIAASSSLLRIGIACFLVVAVLDVVVAWGLYMLLQPVSKSLSLLAAWFRVAYAAAFAMALTPLLSVLQLMAGDTGLEANQAQVMLSLRAFKSGWDLGLVLFGLHLAVLGYVVFKSGFLPKWLGVLIGIAAVGYLVDSFGKLLIPSYRITLSTFTFVGEFLLIFWLLWLGMRGLQRPAVQPQGAH